MSDKINTIMNDSKILDFQLKFVNMLDKYPSDMDNLNEAGFEDLNDKIGRHCCECIYCVKIDDVICFAPFGYLRNTINNNLDCFIESCCLKEKQKEDWGKPMFPDRKAADEFVFG